MWWLKDGQPLRTGSRVRLLTKEHIKITSVTKEDRGMYQCFIKNENDAVQATAEMKLGGKIIQHNFNNPLRRNFLRYIMLLLVKGKYELLILEV